MPFHRAGHSVALLVSAIVVSAMTVGPCDAQTLSRDASVGVRHKFDLWARTVNSGDREAIRKFVIENVGPPPGAPLPVDRFTNRYYGIFSDTGGFDIRNVKINSTGFVTAYAEARRTGYGILLKMAIKPEPPFLIAGFGTQSMEAPEETLPNKPLSDDEIRSRTDALITKLVAADQFSGVIFVARNGQPVYQRATGFANRMWSIPNRVDTRFNLASIGKMFTAVAVAQLVEQGKLTFDTTLDKALPEYPNPDLARKITIGQLLSHTSGLDNTDGSVDKAFAHDYKTITEHLIAHPHDSLKFDPGTKLEYSSYGYLILGAVIEKISGISFENYVRDNIFQPAGMADTDNYRLDTDPSNLAEGYMDAPNHTRRNNYSHLPLFGLPFGLGYGNAADLAKFQAALTSHKLLKSDTLDTVWKARAPYPEKNSDYGYGFIVKRYNGTRIIGHGGGWVGITNTVDMYPDLGYTVVVLNNIDSNPTPLSYKLREWLTQGRR